MKMFPVQIQLQTVIQPKNVLLVYSMIKAVNFVIIVAWAFILSG